MNNQPGLVVPLALVSLFSLASRPVRAEALDVEFQAGQTEVATKKYQEIDKRGYALNLMALKYLKVPMGDLGFGLGAFVTRVEGNKSSRGIRQDLSLKLLTLDARYLYAFDESFSLGPVLRASFGRGAKYGVQQNDDVDILVSPGIMLKYSFGKIDYQPAVSFLYTHDANVAKREVQSYLLGFSVTTELRIGESQVREAAQPAVAAKAEAIPAPQLAPPVVPAPQETQAPPTIVEIKGASASTSTSSTPPASPVILDPMVFRFASNSSRLNGISRERAKALAKVLVEQADAWTLIAITGHSDKSGDPKENKALSKRRTDAFCDLMAKRGVPRKKMRCEAVDFQQLLPGLPDNAEEHRRIELRFEEFDQEKAEALKQALEKNLKF